VSEPVDVGPDGRRSVSDMVRDIMDERGLSRSEMAEFLDRSPRMIGKLLSGESKGESFRSALEELDSKGTLTSPPERRKAKDGHTVPVRARKDDPEARKRVGKDGRELAPVKAPAAREGRYTDRMPENYRARKWATKGGDKRMRIDMPPGDKNAGEKGMDKLRKDFTSLARSQRHKNKQVKIEVTLDDGKKIELFSKGGLNVSKLLAKVKKDFDGNMDAFVRDQVAKNKKSGPAGSHRFASVSVQTFNALTPKQRW
jgi:transcriptional regulator with XRE-family HTH domain